MRLGVYNTTNNRMEEPIQITDGSTWSEVREILRQKGIWSDGMVARQRWDNTIYQTATERNDGAVLPSRQTPPVGVNAPMDRYDSFLFITNSKMSNGSYTQEQLIERIKEARETMNREFDDIMEIACGTDFTETRDEIRGMIDESQRMNDPY
jgi:hypothetical protein